MTTSADVDRAIEILDKRMSALDVELFLLAGPHAGEDVSLWGISLLDVARVMDERVEVQEQRSRMVVIREQMDGGAWAKGNREFCDLLHRDAR